jgi:hypothetical protein
MATPVLFLAGMGILACAVTIVFALMVIGIHQGDRRHLSRTPTCQSDALARRLLVGVRYPSETEEEDL